MPDAASFAPTAARFEPDRLLRDAGSGAASRLTVVLVPRSLSATRFPSVFHTLCSAARWRFSQREAAPGTHRGGRQIPTRVSPRAFRTYSSVPPSLSPRAVASHWPEVLQDQPALGCPIAEEVPRTSRGSGSGYRQHHARRTFVSIARANGARPDVVRWVIHGPTGFGHGRLHDAALGIPLPCGGLLEGRAKDRRGDTEEARGKRGSSRSH